MKFKFHSLFIIFSGKEIRIAFAIFRMRLEKSACQVLRLYRRHLTSTMKRIFEHNSRRPSEKYKLSQSSATMAETANREEIKDRERKREGERRRKKSCDSRSSRITLVSLQSVSRKKVETRLRTIVLNNGENYADCGTPSNTARGAESGAFENGNVSKQDHRESSWHHLCELLCETISRDSHRRRRCESRSTVTILVRSSRYNVAGQCLPIQTSVSDVATR